VISLQQMEFVMTRRDDPADPDPVSRMRYYAHRRGRVQRAYPWVEGLDIVSGLSHRVKFPANVEPRVSPRSYIFRHYPLRTVEQAQRKIARFAFDPEHPDRSHHYVQYSGSPKEFYVDPKHVVRYDEDHAWDFTERLDPYRVKQVSKALRRTLLRLAKLERTHDALKASHSELQRELKAVRAELEARRGTIVD
jgi:hypothetical protein